MKQKLCNYCGQPAGDWQPDKDYENMSFDELQDEWLAAKTRVLGGWWIDYVPICLVQKYHYIEKIYEQRDQKRKEVVRP